MIDVFTYTNENAETIVLSFENGYVVERITGTSGNTVAVSLANSIGLVSSTIQSRNIDPVPMTITGMITGNSAVVRERAERLMAVVLPGVDGRLYHNGSYYRIVTPTATPIIEQKRRFPKFQFSLLAPVSVLAEGSSI